MFIQSFSGVMADILILLHTDSENGLSMTCFKSFTFSLINFTSSWFIWPPNLDTWLHSPFKVNSRSIRYQGFTMCSEVIKFHDLLAPEPGCLRKSTSCIHKQQSLALKDKYRRKYLSNSLNFFLKENKRKTNSASLITWVFSHLLFHN